MGGLFSAPKPPPPPEPPPVAPPPKEDPEEAARAARLKALERRRRGLAGTVVTSYRGVLVEKLPAVERKSLLGE
ncbi:hypothetical protein KO353_09890 [Elioraea tepida]|uniref:Uncharacterized protein n=1 Tax=Elioraea tepida TaxID=2843330 RepID=A0A975TZW6_9PROT|nr:hypothetical protein [Elioraea tepida]QXM23625.1 hypothetical protein KO353_09890 [Elioraea tepida]